MLRQILVGVAVSVCNIAIHAFLMATVIWAARIPIAITRSSQSVRLIAVMIVTVSFLMAAHFAEVLVWASVPDFRHDALSVATPRPVKGPFLETQLKTLLNAHMVQVQGT
jgi:hypothetical protein